MQPPQNSERTDIAYSFNVWVDLTLSIIDNNIEMKLLLQFVIKKTPARMSGRD